ncbi:MAG: response regulator [Ignavibacteriaceae bacterium]|nr:response regulator [Ignavibacteriaceae bacterium]
MKKKILIIEDNFETQLIFKIYLREIYDIKISDNATDGLEEIKNNNFDLLILDVNLPGKLDGNDVLRIVKKELKVDLRVIVVTAFAMKGDMEKFLAQGADDYIAKPVEKAYLMKRIDAQLSEG